MTNYPLATAENRLAPVQNLAHASTIGNTALYGGETSPDYPVQFRTFDAARRYARPYGDNFIDRALSDNLEAGQESMDLRGFMDKVPQTPRDAEVISDVSRIAGLQERTTAMVARNLRVYATPNRASYVRQVRDTFISKLRNGVQATRQGIIDWTLHRSREYPNAASEYRGFEINGVDILDYQAKLPDGIQPTIQVQRQSIGQFVMGYTDAMVMQKVAGTYRRPTRRIYLNPDAEAAPEVFEKMLTAANAAGISLQLKMFQRASEFAAAHRGRHKGSMPLRGDGIVVYTNAEDADKVLGMALSIAEQNAVAFKGRATSRIPQTVAEGIAIGDEPVNAGGRSLTAHRAEIFGRVIQQTRRSGLAGVQARDFFRQFLRKTSAANGVNPDNPAFNL